MYCASFVVHEQKGRWDLGICRDFCLDRKKQIHRKFDGVFGYPFRQALGLVGHGEKCSSHIKTGKIYVKSFFDHVFFILHESKVK